mgnify:CR=1 FL=1
MVFVTVGTHEQPFDRLMREVERLVETGGISDVTVQYGYSTVLPKGCRCEAFLPYEEMQRLYTEADVVVCHGGPSTFLEAVAAGKAPVVVPRIERYGEHVNDHQLAFVREVAERKGGIIPVYDVANLFSAVKEARHTSRDDVGFESHSVDFCRELTRLIKEL